MTEQFNEDAINGTKVPSDKNEKMEVMLEFFLRANPHVKCRVTDITHEWGELSKQQWENLEVLLVTSNLFIGFEKKGGNLFMLKDSARAGLIAAGSYAKFVEESKDLSEMSEEELEIVRHRDNEDNIRKKDEDLRRKKLKENRSIMLVGILVLIVLLILGRILISNIRGR